MRNLAILTLLAIAVAVSSCGSQPPSTTVQTTSSGSWEAQLKQGTGQASLLNFVTTFSINVINGSSTNLDISGFSFINDGACFDNGVNGSSESGAAALNANSTGQVTGTLAYTVKSINPAGNVLTLTSTSVTGTSNYSPGVIGTLSNGIVVGTWTLKGSSDCTGSGTFIMCQGASTCTPTNT